MQVAGTAVGNGKGNGRTLGGPLQPENAKRPPTNLYTAKAPQTATFVSVEKITGPNAPAQTYHIVFDHNGFLPYWEGQVFGVMPPVSFRININSTISLSLFLIH